MSKPKKILYLQHENGLGGPTQSLLYTLAGLDLARYKPIIRMVRLVPQVLELYKNSGFKAFYWPGIETFEHTTAIWGRLSSPRSCYLVLRSIINWKQSQKRTLELVEEVRPDIVHLSSVVLAPSAMALQQAGINSVWHIRESPVSGYFGIRKRIIVNLMKKYDDKVVFISKSDQRNWATEGCGQVIYNYVDTDQYNPDVSGTEVRNKYNIPIDSKVILYLGNINPIKGIFPLLHSLAHLYRKEPQIICLMPNFSTKTSEHWLFRTARSVLPFLGGDLGQRVENLIRELGIAPYLRIAPFQKDIRPFIAASDLVVFPSTVPHFARPVVEAAAMGKPSVASQLDGMSELVQDGETGLLAPANDPVALAAAILRILQDASFAKRLGRNGRQFALENFSMKTQIKKIEALYQHFS